MGPKDLLDLTLDPGHRQRKMLELAERFKVRLTSAKTESEQNNSLKLCGQCPACMSDLSIQNFALAFLSDQPLKARHDLVPPRH